MTATVARLLLAILIFPLSLLVFAMTAGIMIGAANGAPSFGRIVGIWTTTYLFIAMYWIYVWRSVVIWSARRVFGTALAGVTAISTTVPVYLLLRSLGPPKEFCMIASGTLPPVIWVLLTVLLWRETSAERHERLRRRGPDTVACPACGYNMTGLREAKCPECGGSFRLEELAGNHVAEVAEIS